MAIDSIEPSSQISDIAGYIGFQPSSSNVSFMNQLRAENVIDHSVVSFYISSVFSGNSSNVKFGGYDIQGISG